MGVSQIDAESWQAARTRRAGQHRSAEEDGASRLDHRAITDILAVFGDDRRLWTEQLRARLTPRDADRYGTWTGEAVAAVLRPLGVSADQIKLDAVQAAYCELLDRLDHLDRALSTRYLDTSR